MASKLLSCSLACSTQVVFEHETRCLNGKLLIFLALQYKKIPWKYNVEGANVFQKEKETEEETRKPSKWRTARDSPEQGITLVFAGVRGECCSTKQHNEYLDIKYSARIGRTEPGIDSASDGGRTRRSVPRA